MKTINNILLLNDLVIFDFQLSNYNPIHILKNQTRNIANDAGLYLVFCKEDINPEEKHLLYNINDIKYTLVYFGKAGGITKSGKKLVQGLNGRINNVISDSSRNLKDVKRGEYWKIVMEDNKISKLYIFCLKNENPTQIEDSIYEDLGEKKYPLMNKKRGRRNTIKIKKI